MPPSPIAEAFVSVRPDFSGFERDLQAGVNRAFRNLKVPTGTQAGLAGQMFGPGFVQASQQNVSNAVKSPKVPAATQRTMAQSLFGSAFRNESGRALQGVLSGFGGGQLAAQAAFFGPGGAALAVTAGALAGATLAAADFDQALTLLQATTDATDDQMRRASDAARELGRDLALPGISATDAANAILELGKAGLSMENAIAGASGTLRLAAAAQVDTGTAARIAASALNAFDLAGTEAAHVADLLAGASIAAQGEVSDMALSLQQSAAVADQAGLSLEQLVGLITELARQGILGSDAGTSIRTMLLRLAPTTKEAAQVMDALGIQLDNTRTIGEQLPEVLDQYRVALSRLNPIQRQQVLTQIFGTDAIRSATVAIENGSRGLQSATDAANQQGAAAKLAKAQSEGATGAFKELGDAGVSIGITFGQVTLPAVESLTRGLTDLVQGADLGVSALKNLISEDIGHFDQLFGGGEQPAAELSGRIQQITSDLDEAIERIEKFGGSFDRIADENVQFPMEAEVVGLVRKLKEELEPALKSGALTIAEVRDILAQLHLPPELANSFRDLVPEAGRIAEDFEHGLGGLDAVAAREGKKVGKTLSTSIAEGITEDEQKIIDAARQSLADVRTAGTEQIIASITSARSNLESLGSSLGESLQDIIDVGPIADEIEKVNKALDDLQEKTTRRQLRFDFRDAKSDLREAQESILSVGELDPREKAAQEKFLDPFKEGVKDAKAALKEFDLTEHREDLEKTLEAQKKAANEGLQVLIDKFETGKITVGEFTALLNQQLQPALGNLKANSKDLGFVFTRDFKRDMATFVRQAKAVAPFLGTPGTTPGTQIERPAQTVADVQRQVAAAERALADAIKDAKAKNTEENGSITALLTQIRNAVRGNSNGRGPAHN